jgi:hypothetical protein
VDGPAGARRQEEASSRARRRAGIALAGALALVASLASATAVAGASSAGRRGGTATRAVGCTAPALSARLETAPGFVASASGEAVWTVLLVNTGRRSCSLEGWPQLTLVAPSGAVHHANQIDTINGAFGAVEPTALTLRTRGGVAFFVAVPGGGSCSHPFELRVATSFAGATANLDAGRPRICSASESIEASAIHPASVHLFQDYPGPAGTLDPAAVQHPAFPACDVQILRELRSAVAPQRPMGYEEVEIFLQDAASACSLRSRWPVVSLLGGGSVLVPAVRDVALLPADVVPLGGSQSPPTYVDLAHGAVALFDILFREPPTPRACRRATSIEVRLDVTPGPRWSQVPPASYRPAVGIPACAGETSLALDPAVWVTPISAVPHHADPPAKRAQAPAPVVVSPSGDAAGFGWGGDSSGGVCTGGTYPYGVEGLAKYGISGKCGGYFGQVGAAWSQWPGCPDSGWGWNATDAAEAAANYPKYGVGNAFIYFTGGPGMKPPAVATLKSWADMQMTNFAAQAAESQYRGYVDEPVVILDVETGYGWNDTVTDPTSGTLGCAFPIVTSGTYRAADNKALLSDMVSEASAVFPGYEVVVYTGGRYDWDPWFGSEPWTGGEYTFVNAIAGTPGGSSGNEPGKFCLRAAKSPCAQFWGRESSSSAGALLWQWASPVPPSSATVDIDQIDEGHFPVAP